MTSTKKKRSTNLAIKEISDYVLRTQAKQVLIKHKISKLKDKNVRFVFEQDYEEISKEFNDTLMEFNMLKYLYWNIERPDKKAK